MELVSINKYGSDVFLIVLHFSHGHKMMTILEESWKFCNSLTSFRLENKVMNQYLASALAAGKEILFNGIRQNEKILKNFPKFCMF